MSLYKLFLIGLGGGLGSISRFVISHFMHSDTIKFPWPTLLANIISCFILGLCYKNYKINETQYLLLFFVMIGFCGGLSTFSTFTAENFQLIQQSQFGLFVLYSFLSLTCCLLFFWLGSV